MKYKSFVIKELIKYYYTFLIFTYDKLDWL